MIRKTTVQTGLGLLLIATGFPSAVFGLLLGEEVLVLSSGISVAGGFYLLVETIKRGAK